MSLISALFGMFLLQSYVKVSEGYHIDFERDPLRTRFPATRRA
jgi:hypothetical protein